MHFATVVRTIALESFTQLPMYTKRNSLIAVGAVTTLLGCELFCFCDFNKTPQDGLVIDSSRL